MRCTSAFCLLLVFILSARGQVWSHARGFTAMLIIVFETSWAWGKQQWGFFYAKMEIVKLSSLWDEMIIPPSLSRMQNCVCRVFLLLAMLQLPVKSCGNYSVGLLKHVKLLAYRALHYVRAIETERQKSCFNPTLIYKFLRLFVTFLLQAQGIPRTMKIQGVAQRKIPLIPSGKMKGCTMFIFNWLCPTGSLAKKLNQVHRHLKSVNKSK